MGIVILRVNVLLLVWALLDSQCQGMQIHWSTVPLCEQYNYKDTQLALPNDGSVTYNKLPLGHNKDSLPFVVTKDGLVLLKHPLCSFYNKNIVVGASGKNSTSGLTSHHKIIFKALNDRLATSKQPEIFHSRRKRAVEVSISKTVDETAEEIILDYASVGVISDDYNEYTLVEDPDVPFTSVDVATGKLLVNQKHRLDYETAPEHQYQLTVNITNRLASREYIVDVTIKLRDVNDEPPVFTMEPYPYLAVFNANLPPNSKVDYVISVRDPDANSKLVYSLLEGSSKFRITQDGELFTTDRLTKGSEYTVKVQVVDDNAQQFIASQKATADIYIRADRRPPQFFQSIYETSVSENVQSVDLDILIRVKSFQGDAISFTMPDSQVFMIVESARRPNEAKIRVTKSLDYETDARSYSLIITATERLTLLSSTARLTVRITDINDNTPIFDISEYVDSTVWKEDSKVGTTIIKVQATDMDPSEIDSGTITYSLQSDLGDALPFAVETQQAVTGYVGVIKVSGNLDYETIDGTGYRFKVIATDQGVPAKASSAYVRVQVENTNDERPQFNSISIEKIEATKTVNSVVATVLALDPDGDKVTYGIVGSEPSRSPFRIDPTTGSVTLTADLMNEAYADISSFTLNVSATDDGSCCELGSQNLNVGYTTVIIEIVGRNHPPEFSQCATYSILAKAPENTANAFVVQVEAEDKDVGPYGELKYSLIVSGANLFRIDENTGEIWTAVSTIDREKTSSILITVKAEDGGQSKLTAFCTFTMQVLDLNDNDPSPSFQSSQDAAADAPPNTSIYDLFAVDPDFGRNGTTGLTFTVTGNDNFYIDGQTLRNRKLLASLEPKTQVMTITVTDGGNRSKSVEFTVNIRQDASPPVFTQVPEPGFKILENLTDDTIIARIKAETATGGPVNYYLVPTTTLGAFHMLTDNQECNTNNELCLAVYQSQNLDADRLRFYKLRVRVTPQSGGSNVAAEETIDIELIDVNDNIPVFENIDNNGYIIGSVDENSTVINTRVVELKANDSDITPAFKTKTYTLEPGEHSSLFRVDMENGVVGLYVNTDFRFDREKVSQYVVKVKATDGAPSARPQSDGQPNSQITAVQVNVNDINDNEPYFPQDQYDGQVEETAPKGRRVMNIRASDLDIQNNFKYITISGNDNQAFEIADTGDVLVFDSSRLDYESKKVYNMVVEVSDGRFQARTNVHIKLLDMNDNVPEFTQRVYTVTNVVEEDPDVSTTNRFPIVKVKATDADVDRPNNITYDISGALSDRFQINPTSGQVYLVKSLDRDLQSHWDINVLAYDEPNTPTTRIGYAIISVIPIDINDNDPVFRENTLYITIPENVATGSQILTIRADDKDEGNNGKVQFRLNSQSVEPRDFPATGYPYFSIEPSGVVKTLAKFDREVVDKYTLEVIAYDEGTPNQRTVTGTVTVNIGDVNDNPPYFIPDVYERRVSELAGPQSFIVQVLVEDLDSDATFAFLLDDQALKNFSIDNQGNIFIRDQQRLDFEHFHEKGIPPVINIEVTVKDGIYEDTANVKITVVDENDETPTFNPNTVTVDLLESVPIDTPVHTFTATDRDASSTPRNSEIEYYISRTLNSDFDRYFKIDVKSGEVKTQKFLDRELLETHTVKVLAVDNGFPHRRTGTSTLIVVLDDVNDNGPRLVDPVVHIVENMPIGSHTIPREILAVDDDDNKIGHGPPFRMVPTNGSQANPFLEFIFHEEWDVPAGLLVANGAGEVLTKTVLDREASQGAEIDFYLQLFDKQNKSDTRQLTVVVADEDDNPPSPGHRDALVYNYKGEYQIVDIGDCYAEDPDDWDKPYKTYEKVGEWNSGFSIDSNSGMITVDMRELPSGVYEFRCKVIDNYIKDTTCAFNCNVEGGTAAQVELCKDKCRVKAEAISTVRATIKTIEEAPVWNGASIRIKGTALEFLEPDSTGQSPYDTFITRMANTLNTNTDSIDVFSVLDSNTPGYVDIRYSAHGSPYYNTSKLIGAVLDDPELGKALGMPLAQVPINECLQEVCDSGCTNTLVILDIPTLVNANGSSLVGVTVVVEANCTCSTDDGSEDQYCTPESCLNGGVCIYNKHSRTTSCECPKSFDGPRCQQLRHSFSGNGWAQYKTLSQCGNGTTSIEVMTAQSNGIILYNGPNTDPGSGADAVTDYLAITLSNGKPVVYVDYGTGHVILTVNKVINDGKWHKLEVAKIDRVVTLTVDDCRDPYSLDPDTSQVSDSRNFCQDTQPTPGENRFLNVATLVELGGRQNSATTWWPNEVQVSSRSSFNGCVKKLKHNGELYDLYIGAVGRHSNSEDSCPREDRACTDSNGMPVCGANGVCTGRMDGKYTCECKPGWRGDGCLIETGYMDFSPNSYVEWKMESFCQSATECLKENFETDIRLSFRSRDTDNNGLLFYVQGNVDGEYIKLLIVAGQLQLRYNIGSDVIDPADAEQIATLPVTVTDGDLHHVTLTRYGKRFTLQLDGGEGRYFAQHEDVYSHQLFATDGRFVSGADILASNISASSDLDNTCVTDIRYNNKWLPSTESENSQSADIRLLRRQNVAVGCSSDGCADVNCPGIQQCVDIWRDFDCRCPGGYITLYTAPYCEDINECFPNNPCFHGKCINTKGSFTCDCDIHEDTKKLYTGQLCNLAPSASKLLVASNGIIALIMAILLVLLLALGIFCYVTRRSSIQKSETLIDPYNDIKETIYNYDEEGMPEEDQHGYDISRLSKPLYPNIHPFTDVPLQKSPPEYNDQPDVGNFINGRLNDADDDPTNCPGDELKDYDYEGMGSDAGTLSSLHSSSSGGDQDFDYLNDWGPKFSRLADMYAGEDDL